MNETILIVEDDPKMRSGLRDNLEFEGYRVFEAWNAEAGAQVWRDHNPALVILDLMLPGKSGFQLLREMRRRGRDTPVIILSARGEEWDKVKGFRLGCDDYVVKPFSLLELLGRIGAVIKRVAVAAPCNMRLKVGDAELDVDNLRLSINGRQVNLSGKECELAAYFFQNPGRVLSRRELLSNVWRTDPELQTRTVDVYVAALRQKLDGSCCRIETMYKAGYRLSHLIPDC